MSLYGPVFTAIYGPLLAGGERAGMLDLRREVLSGATGEVLEPGAGTGPNINACPPTVARLTLTEPEASMVRPLIAGPAHAA